MTLSYGPRPIRVYRNDGRTDSALATQAKNNYKYSLRQKKKKRNEKSDVVDDKIENNNISKQ